MLNLNFKLLLFGSFLLILFSSACNRGRSQNLSKKQRKELRATYDSMQTTYNNLMSRYKANADTSSPRMRSLYRRMQKNHQAMTSFYQQMMNGNMGRHMMRNGNGMMGNGMRGGMHMSRSQYGQMMAMHQDMAQIHRQMGQQDMAQMNQRMYQEYDRMKSIIWGSGASAGNKTKATNKAALPEGQQLFTQYCSSCHGSNAQGMGSAFPPLINSKLVTAEKSVPIRIVSQGLQGQVSVRGNTYQGFMPSFGSQLSAAQAAAILNYLRKSSKGSYPDITKQDVIEVQKKYSNRTTPWTIDELTSQN
ncbi:MAG TPA: cytochrome c [Balneolaceae bacterium]|nr:cytochrome c [Balneolaceae bacterium]